MKESTKTSDRLVNTSAETVFYDALQYILYLLKDIDMVLRF